MLTSAAAAVLLNTGRRNVQNYCKRHDLPKFGREYMITDADIDGMRAELGKPGRKPALDALIAAQTSGKEKD